MSIKTRIGRVVNNNTGNRYRIGFYGVGNSNIILDNIMIYSEDNIYYNNAPTGLLYFNDTFSLIPFFEVFLNEKINEPYVCVVANIISSYTNRGVYSYGGHINTYGEQIAAQSYPNYILCDLVLNFEIKDLNRQLSYENLLDRLFIENNYYVSYTMYFSDIKYYDNGQQIKKNIPLYSREWVKFNLQLTKEGKLKSASYNIYKKDSIKKSGIQYAWNTSQYNWLYEDLYHRHGNKQYELKYIYDENHNNHNSQNFQLFNFVFDELNISNLNNDGYFHLNNDIFLYDEYYLKKKRILNDQLNKLASIDNILDENVTFDNIYVDIKNNILNAIDSSGYVRFDNNDVVYYFAKDNHVIDTTSIYFGLLFSSNTNETDFVNYIFSFKLDVNNNVLIDKLYNIPIVIYNLIYAKYNINYKKLVIIGKSKLFDSDDKATIIILDINDSNEIQNVQWNTSPNIDIQYYEFNKISNNVQLYKKSTSSPFYRRYCQFNYTIDNIENFYNMSIINIYHNMLDSNNILLEVNNIWNDYSYEKVRYLTDNSSNINEYMLLDFGKVLLDEKYIKHNDNLYILENELFFDTDKCISDLNIKFHDGTYTLLDYNDCDIVNVLDDLTTSIDIINYFYTDKTFIFLECINNTNMQFPKNMVIYNTNKYNTIYGKNFINNYKVTRVLKLSQPDKLYIKLG